MKVALSAAFALCLTGAAAAAPAGDKVATEEKLYLPLEGKRTPAVMHATPSNEQLQREYPPVALAMNLAGEATITCTTTLDGRLDDCKVDGQSPDGLGFGAAALRLAAYFTLTPPTFDGHAFRGRITIPIRFRMGGEKAPPPVPEQIPPPSSAEALSLAREVVTLRGDAGALATMAHVITERLTMQVVATGDAAAGERIADAYRLGVADFISEEVETRARLLAASMTASQLRATLAYLRTPAGVAYRTVQARIDEPSRLNPWTRIATAARTHLCDHSACSTPPEIAAGATPIQ